MEEGIPVVLVAGWLSRVILTLLADHLRYKTGHAYPKDVYANDAEYFADIAKAYQAEIKILYDAGCRNVTIDDPNLACECPPPSTPSLFSCPRVG